MQMLRRKGNAKMIQTEKECYICQSPNVELHHIFLSANRKLSDKYGLTVYLCHYHHQDHKQGVHHNKDLMQKLHEVGQKYFEEHHGTREDFMRLFGRNYLE